MVELVNELEQERDYLISQLINVFDAEEQNRLIGRIYQHMILINKLKENEGCECSNGY